MNDMLRAPLTPRLPGLARDPSRWLWVAVILSILVCMLIAWLYYQQQQALEQSITTLDTIRQARIDLAEGFLHASLAADPAMPFDREKGLAVLDQSIVAFESSAALLEQHDQSTAAFQRNVQAFHERLAAWRTATATPESVVELSVALDQLEGAADRLDEQLRAGLRRQSERLDTIFVWVLSGAAVLLAGICGAVLVLERIARDAEHEMRRLFQQVQRSANRLQHLRALDQAILAERSLGQIAEAAVIHIGQLMPTVWVGIMLHDADTRTFPILALLDCGATRVPETQAPPGISGAELASLARGHVYQITDVAALPEQPEWISLDHDRQIRSYFHMPIMAGAELLALLHVGADTPDAFTAEHIEIAREVADQLSVAIQQARLHEQVARHAQELEQRVVARTAELVDANKELEAFSYSVSHDLRAPLRAIDGFSRILLDDYVAALPEEARHYFQLICDNATQMGRLVDDLLAFSRLSRQPLNTRPVDMAALVCQCLEELRSEQAGRQIELKMGKLPDCAGDMALLKQVWFNLIANALKYTRRRERAEIEIGSRVEQGETIYFITDNGVGFDMRYANKLFGVFQRLHRAEEYEGTGVGLAIVARIVHRHGGRVWAEAAPDHGATFYIALAENHC